MASSEAIQTPRPPETGGGRQAPATRPFQASFLDHLVKNAIIAPEIARRAAAVKHQNAGERRSLLDILHEEFGVARDILQYQMAQFYAFRTIDINEHLARRLGPTDVMKLVRGLPEQHRALAMKHKVLPYDTADNQPEKLIVVTPNPSDRETSEVARAFQYKKFEICYMRERDWNDLWRMVSTDQAQTRAPLELIELVTELDDGDLEAVIDREISRTQAAGLIESILADAVRTRASAVHLVPLGVKKTDVFFRTDGVLSHWTTIDEIRTEALAAMLKMRTPGMDRYERLAPQEGAFVKSADGQAVHFHVSSLPIALRGQAGRFEMLVVQIEREPAVSWQLETIGLDEAALRAHREVLGMRSGLVVLTGPAGSGITTTMAAMMRALAPASLSTLAVEESMKFAFDGVHHVRLTPKLSYKTALGVIERHDPDVVILGEICDREGADLALRLAMRGRRVFATMLAADTAGAVVRLQGLGVEPYLLAHGLMLVHAQRMIRRLCPQCRQIQAAPDPRLEHLGLHGQGLMLYRPVGCIECVNGFQGLAPLHEALLVTPAVRALITGGGPQEQGRLQEILGAQGARSLWQAAAELLWAGGTTLDEVWTALS